MTIIQLLLKMAAFLGAGALAVLCATLLIITAIECAKAIRKSVNGGRDDGNRK